MKRSRPHFRPRTPPPGLTPNLTSLKILLERSGIELKPAQLDQLWRYHNLLRLRNQDRDLTRITGFEPMVIKHYVDCMIVGEIIKLPSPLVDVGTGAGFPGIPLKIRYPDLAMILAEPRPKRIEFLKEACKNVGLKNTQVFEHKVVSASLKTPVKGVITRAVEDIEKTILRTSGALEVGGKLIFLKGPSVDPEIKVASRRFKSTHKLIMDHAYQLPHTSHLRRLVVFERIL
jgi:16S rRNA (guanine(527)-N(7))-methyltransferase RsmG